MGREYWVLTQDNLPEIAVFTGKTEDELQKMYADCMMFGHIEVFWKIFDQWYGVRVNSEYVFYGLLDRSIEKAMEISFHEYKNGDRRG